MRLTASFGFWSLMPGILAEPILVLARLRQGVHFSCAYCLKPGRGEERGRKRRQGFLPCTGLRSWPHLLRIASQAGSWFVQAVGTVVAAHTLLDLVKPPLRKWPGGACLVCTAPSRPLTHKNQPDSPFNVPPLRSPPLPHQDMRQVGRRRGLGADV